MKRNGKEEHVQIPKRKSSDSGKDALDQARDLMEVPRWHLEEDSSSLKLTDG